MWWINLLAAIIFFVVGATGGFVLGYDRKLRHQAAGTVLVFKNEGEDPTLYLSLKDIERLDDDYVLFAVDRNPH
jgi:hypothetical protein